MIPLPSVFISHGSPMHTLQAGRAGTAWAALGKRLGKPQAILIASAHWETNLPMVTGTARPEPMSGSCCSRAIMATPCSTNSAAFAPASISTPA